MTTEDPTTSTSTTTVPKGTITGTTLPFTPPASLTVPQSQPLSAGGYRTDAAVQFPADSDWPILHVTDVDATELMPEFDLYLYTASGQYLCRLVAYTSTPFQPGDDQFLPLVEGDGNNPTNAQIAAARWTMVVPP